MPNRGDQLKMTLRRNGTDWSAGKSSELQSGDVMNSGVQAQVTPNAGLSNPGSKVVENVVVNVNSFLSGIRATFRSENVIVQAQSHSKKSRKDII